MRIFTKTFWFAPIIGTLWLKAQTYNHKKNYQQSLKLLKRIEALTSKDTQPMGGIFAEYSTLLGHVLYAMGKTEPAVDAFKKGVRAARYSSNYNDEEKDYIQAYASIEHPDASPPLKGIDEDMLADIRLGDVRMDIKLALPMFKHPNWPHPELLDEEQTLEIGQSTTEE
ncbi:MAG: tetratricopeptide repeat protein [Gammaproteobacteria bacterium]|nr:tetratricopeptide repeat protein [Gammaproteobacteria bacterium]